MQGHVQSSHEPTRHGSRMEIPPHTLSIGKKSCSYIEKMRTCVRILEIVCEYSLHKLDGTIERLAVGKPKFLSVIERFVLADAQVDMCLPAFPFKSANKTFKVFGTLPDKAEELALGRLESICLRIGAIYPPGAALTIISDGLVYNGQYSRSQYYKTLACLRPTLLTNFGVMADLLSISDRDTWAYGEALRELAENLGLQHVYFSRIRDLVNFPGPKDLNEITYIASATDFRRCLLNQYGKDDLDIDQELRTCQDTMMTYLGYRRFLESDLRHVFPIGNERSMNGFKSDVRYLAKQMLIRGYAFARAVKSTYPDHLRLSIHQSTFEHKISLSLLDTKTGFTTPWHCSVALMADGEWLSAPKGDFERDVRLEVVHKDGRPSFFQEKICEPNPNPSA